MLIAHLDTPQQGGGETQVRYLHYADAEKLEKKLKEQISGVAAAASGAGGAAGGATPQAQESKNSIIWSDKDNNALVTYGAAEDTAADQRYHRQTRHPPSTGPGGGHHRRCRPAKILRTGRELGHLVGDHEWHHIPVRPS